MTSFTAQFSNLSESLQCLAQTAAVERLTAQLEFARQLCLAHPDRAETWQPLILEAGRLACDQLQRGRLDLLALAEAILSPLTPAAKQYTLLCVSHAHIDMNWMWSWPETVAVTHDTFQTMLQLMDEFPDFVYSQSQASTYRLIEKYNPEMFQQIKHRIAEGRWEVTASQWVEGDKNMAGGESLSRHLLYTREYMEQRFGLKPEDVTVAFEPDTFGHPATLPTLLARGGVRHYYHCRGSHGPHLYWWIGPDGSRLLTFNDVTWYMCAIRPQIVKPMIEFSLSTGLRQMPVLYGVGDHGGGPTRRDLRRIGELNTWPVFPQVRCAALREFFEYAEQNAIRLPEVVGERNFVFTGCYTSQARQKWANRHGENLLYAAEAAALLGHRLAGVPYPQQNLDEAWRGHLFNQFHDILPGSGVRETRHYTLGQAQETQAAAAMARTCALRALAEHIDTESLRRSFTPKGETPDDTALGAGVGFASGSGDESAFSAAAAGEQALMIWNPLPYPRREVIEATLWDVKLNKDSLVMTTEGLPPCRVQVLEEGRYWGHTFVRVAFPIEVPALGYRAVCISDRLAELGLDAAEVGDPWAGMLGNWRKIMPDDFVLENEWLRAQLDPASGGLISLVDRRNGREWVPQGDLSGILQYSIEGHIGMTAWVIGPFLTQQDLIDGGMLKQIHGGPYVRTFRWTRTVSNSKLELDITLRQGMPHLDFRLRVDWREIGSPAGIPNLRVRFPLAAQEAQARYEIPYGSILRSLNSGEEVVAQRWADVGEADGGGVTLVNTSKYGHSLEQGTLSLTLMRASIDPDPLPDLGEHLIEYALVPHPAGWSVGQAMQAAEQINIPLVVSSCGFHSGDLPSSAALVSVEPTNVRLGTIKQSQCGRAMVLRLVEVEGCSTEARVTLTAGLLPVGVSAIETDTLERPLEANGARLEGNCLTVQMPAYGVSTVRVG